MADLDTTKQRNADFLRQMEQQRLLKTCTKIIDLRGKVAGECQAYQFGGLTHYLDDRAYLIAKQLLDRFKGRYTTGVNEALLKAIKTVSTSVDEIKQKQETKPILLRNKDAIQYLAFEHLLKRTEPRIFFSTPIQLHLSDVLYHAHTVDITTSAIRIVLKRAYTLEEGDKVTIDFDDFAKQAKNAALSRVHYTIFKIEHDELRTYAILIRQRQDNPVVTSWLDAWSQQHNTIEHLDLDDLLLNIARHYYLRLYAAELPSPLFWLGSDGKATTKIGIVNVINAQQQLAAFMSTPHIVDFDLLPFEQLNQSQRLLIVLSRDTESCSSQIASLTDRDGVISAISAFHQHKSSAAVLVESKEISLDLSLIDAELKGLSDEFPSSTKSFIEQLEQIHAVVSVTDISVCLANVQPPKQATTLQPSLTQGNWSVPEPMQISPDYKVPDPHYFIKTPVIMSVQGADYEVMTSELSVSNVFIRLEQHIDIALDAHVRLNFTRWQSQTKTVKLNAVPYSIKHVSHWQGSTLLELERNSGMCTQSINHFFISAIERNREQLVENDLCHFIAPQSHLLIDAISKTMPAIPLYLAMDADNKRIL
jgi:hypothetical protein